LNREVSFTTSGLERATGDLESRVVSCFHDDDLGGCFWDWWAFGMRKEKERRGGETNCDLGGATSV